MTRTSDIIVSTIYQDLTIGPNCGFTKYSLPVKECDSQMVGTQNQDFETINKRHCRSFDFIESLDDPNICSLSMENPYTSERQTVNKDVWYGIGQQGHLRFSSPDIFNTKLFHQQTSTDKTSESAQTTVPGKTRSQSATKVRGPLTPVPITVSQPSKRGQSPVYYKKETGGFSQTRESSFNTSRPLVNEVHPVKLQPHTPLFVSDCFRENRLDKPANSPHVRYRVDIKPDEAVLQHTTWKQPTARSDIPWQRYSSSSFRSMSVPRQMSTSTTPTPSESYSMDYKHSSHYPNSMPRAYIQPAEIPLGETSLRYPRKYRNLSIPNIPTKFFYTEDPIRCSVQSPGRTYFQENQYTINSSNRQNPSLSGQCMNDSRSQWVHTMPLHTHYAESYQEPLNAYYSRPYSVSEPGPYFMPSPAVRTHCRESAREYAFPSDYSKIFCTRPFHSPAECPIPIKAFHKERRHLPDMFPDEWYRSSIATCSSHHPSSQVTPQKVPAVSRQCANHLTEPSPLGDVRNYSKSWENILIPHMEKEHRISRGRSYENLYHQGRERVPSDNTQKPVIINLSSSPRRYAALSISENSLEKCASKRRTGIGCHWFVTPEITITDNEICSGNNRKKDGNWDGRQAQNTNTHNPKPSNLSEPSERKHNNSSLQQSLEQLDELLADLVFDYKPQNSEDLIDQLKLLINDEVKGEKSITDQEDSGLLNTQTSSLKTSQDTFKDPDSGCEGFQMNAEDITMNQSADEHGSMMCSNKKCQHMETLFNASLYFKSCHSCHTYYCSRNCRREDWDTHKDSCLHGRINSACRHILRHCRENSEIHKAFSRIAKVGYLSRGRGILFIGFQNTDSADTFLKVGLERITTSPTYLSLRELDSFKDNLGEYCKELQDAGKDYDPSECFLLNVSIAITDNRTSPRLQATTVRKYAKMSLASTSPDKKVLKKENDMETLILTPPPGTSAIDKEGHEGRKAREICFINIQKELRTRGVFLRHEFPQIYNQLCEFVENNKRFTPTTIYPIDKRTGKQFMCMIMAASEPRTLDWICAPHLLDDIT
ncbi:apical junction component 1 homolog [Salminus brasiliensis]|uniref:apical junction component 1 homolog n=1 Tax=Salminus brasiliensis TaxID=930266 RepID=UPI003B82F4D0